MLRLPTAARVSVAHVVGCDPDQVARLSGGRITVGGTLLPDDRRQQALFWQGVIEVWMGCPALDSILSNGPDRDAYMQFRQGIDDDCLNDLIRKVKNGECD